jgi:hypothetical protein
MFRRAIPESEIEFRSTLHIAPLGRISCPSIRDLLKPLPAIAGPLQSDGERVQR